MIICIRFRNLNMSCLYQEKAQKLRFFAKKIENCDFASQISSKMVNFEEKGSNWASLE